MLSPKPALNQRRWVGQTVADLTNRIGLEVAKASISREARGEIAARIEELTDWNETIHSIECINLNPATNTMNPQAEKLLARGLGSRPSLGHPSDKYEMGLEAIERIEIITAELAAQLFDAPYVEIRVGSGALANLYAFLACTEPGDTILVPPPTIGGHVTHHEAGAAGLRGLRIEYTPIDPGHYTVDLASLADSARRHLPKMITVGASLNLSIHDVGAIRAIADEVGAIVMFDAAHLSGPIAGGAWPNPLQEGAHIMTMSTYKSLAGPPSGLLLTTSAEIAERIDAIAFPGLTANFDVAKSAALAISLLDWLECGSEHAAAQVATAKSLAYELRMRGVEVFELADGTLTESHAFALRADERGGHATACHLRRANLLTSAIGLPDGPDTGVRVGTNELVRWGASSADMPEVADLLAEALDADDPSPLGERASALRQRFNSLSFVRPQRD